MMSFDSSLTACPNPNIERASSWFPECLFSKWISFPLTIRDYG